MNLLRKIVLSWYAVALVLSVFYLLGLDVAVGGGINIYVPLAFALLIVKGLTEIDSARTVGKTLRILSIISLVFFSVWTLDPTIETTMKHTLFAIFHIGTLALSWYMIRKGNRAEQDKQAQRSE